MIDTFYRDEIAPVLPERVLDFHTHIWSSKNWSATPWKSDITGGKYMTSLEEYPAESLLADGKLSFPDRVYEAVCFGYPCPIVDWEKDTAFVASQSANHPELHPLVICGKDLDISRQRYEEVLATQGFKGFKVCLNWQGDDYGNISVQDMVGATDIAVANENKLIVLLHVPRSGRLADPEVQQGVEWLSKECPQATIVLAHCGRCYIASEMRQAIDSIKNLGNVHMDTSMVMDPLVLQIAMDNIGSQRLVYGSDFPIAAMKGRRVRVMDHWVDVVMDEYPEGAFRVQSNGIRATYMAVEIVVAIRDAAEMVGISDQERSAIFYDNGHRLLSSVGG